MTDVQSIAGFAREADARLLLDYLHQQGIAVRYQLGDDSYPHRILLLDSSQQEKARSLVAEFVHNPHADKYQQAAWAHGQAMQGESESAWSGLNLSARGLPFTLSVLLACILVYVASLLGWFVPLLKLLHFQDLDTLVAHHQWWRLIGPAFVHFSALHIVFNLLWWWVLGGQVERQLGTSHLLLVFLVTAIASNTGQFMVSGPNFGGLSGVVYGLMGFVWWCGWLRPAWGLSLSKPLVGFMLVWLVLGYADILWVSMANTAHTLGLVSGCVLAWLYCRVWR
ncbi:rhomboid family intramembrane serine protease GlpG [Aliiglaciecola sp. CAU 1673]|uniref:rhomboid family intramembrane serine protease GlpG n=1 Tax=Aliiglaciecola sp. CAU 1673 TaxID=3032595 RepID=UPI0023DA4368|nr:rhomboid family intramembrane serine protease GlpG [Aliiglaciecola sp. CAU 1673]MDF2179265.1 rhomboid family intramembrane serine protease GlpG [Aliiglaciecola sp. CAU 1673]